LSSGVVEDDAEREAPARSQRADPVPHRRAVEAAGAGNGAMVQPVRLTTPPTATR